MSREQGRKRTRLNDGVGYAHNSFLTTSGAAVVSNARLKYSQMQRMFTDNKSALWPAANTTHAKFLPARKGIVAFSIVNPGDTYSSNIIGPHIDYDTLYKNASYSPELDHIQYYSMLNGMGDSSYAPDITKAQRSFIRCVRPLGLIVSDIENAANLSDQPNTIMHDFGKMTIPNVGDQDIDQSCDISVDCPTTNNYSKYGLAKIDAFEPGCYTLIPVPTRSVDNTIDFIKEYLSSEFRNKTHQKEVLQMVRGAMGLSSIIQAYVFKSAGQDSMPDPNGNVTNAGGVLQAEQQGLIYTFRSAILAIDEEYDKSFLQSIQEVRDKQSQYTIDQECYYNIDQTLPFYDVSTQNNATLSNALRSASLSQNRHIGLSIAGLGGMNFHPDIQKLMESSFDIDRSIHDLITGLSSVVQLSSSLKIGMAVTPASVGKDFDIILSKR